jgi:hypothetical protein
MVFDWNYKVVENNAEVLDMEVLLSSKIYNIGILEYVSFVFENEIVPIENYQFPFEFIQIVM